MSLLVEVVRVLAQHQAGPAGADDVLHRVAALLAGRCDWVLADRLDEPDLVTRVAAYGPAGPLVLPAGMGAGRARRSSAGAVGLLPALRAVPQRVLRLDPAAIEQLACSHDPHLAAQARGALALGARHLVVLGLVGRDQLVGVLTLSRAVPTGDEEVAELLDVARHVGLALEVCRLAEVQRTVATALQTSLLPPVPSVPGLHLAARYVPATRGLDVGGDWYDAFPTDAGVVLVVGDVSGHDVPAAARMADLRNLLRAHAVDRDEPPSALVTRLEQTADRLGLDALATLVVGRLVPLGDGDWQLTWTSAGHLPPVVAGAGPAQLLATEPDLMLGVDRAAVRTDHRLVLRRGDTVVLCSDGLVEQRGTSLEDRLEQLRALVGELAPDAPDRLAERLLAALAPVPADDVALLVVTVLPGQQRPIVRCARE